LTTGSGRRRVATGETSWAGRAMDIKRTYVLIRTYVVYPRWSLLIIKKIKKNIIFFSHHPQLGKGISRQLPKRQFFFTTGRRSVERPAA
jgi:hypothetical protein